MQVRANRWRRAVAGAPARLVAKHEQATRAAPSVCAPARWHESLQYLAARQRVHSSSLRSEVGAAPHWAHKSARGDPAGSAAALCCESCCASGCSRGGCPPSEARRSPSSMGVLVPLPPGAASPPATAAADAAARSAAVPAAAARAAAEPCAASRRAALSRSCLEAASSLASASAALASSSCKQQSARRDPSCRSRSPRTRGGPLAGARGRECLRDPQRTHLYQPLPVSVRQVGDRATQAQGRGRRGPARRRHVSLACLQAL